MTAHRQDVSKLRLWQKAGAAFFVIVTLPLWVLFMIARFLQGFVGWLREKPASWDDGVGGPAIDDDEPVEFRGNGGVR